ncbi:MAG TPA: cytidine deaminase [Solirubrobacteraceae bacterium]|nr:cytidine deaminase [Solirubrobacteraceae bacterium]
MSAPRRNVELKATDPDPARSLAVCRELGASDEGILVQRDTYYRVPEGRLKLREQTPGGAVLIQYRRDDRPEARESRYRLVPVEDADAARVALDDALGTLAVVDKERHLFLWEGVRIHLDTVKGLGSFVELEGVAPADSDLSGEHDRVAQLREALGIDDGRILSDSYSDLVLVREGSEQLIAAARDVMERAYAPYSRYRVGVALRAPDGSVHVGANVENAAYPLGNCAEASAIGAMLAAGRTQIVEAAVIGDGEEPCVPCGGCRQRLREFMPLDATVHLLAEKGARATMTLEELLPRSFGPEYLP